MKQLIAVMIGLWITSSVFAQTNSGWVPIHLTVSGYNMQDGVEAFFQLNKCNEEDVVFLKLINHNADAVTVEWTDAIFTKELKWVSKENATERKSLTINANETVQGDCLRIDQSKLVVKINDFIKKTDDFKLYGTTFFQVTFKN